MENKPACYVKDRVIPELYSGIPTYMGLPKINNKEELKDFDLAIMGIPFEAICTWGSYSGCELATKSIRAASLRYGGYLPEYDTDIFDYFKGGDYGDVPTDINSIEKTHENISAKMDELLDAGVFPISYGGDHSVTYPILKSLAKKHNGKIGIVHLDAHFDNMPSYGDTDFGRCSPLYKAYSLEGIDPKNIVHVGIRGPRNNPLGMKAIRESGASLITSFEIKEKGLDYTIQKAIEIAKEGTEAVYVTVCSDVLDVAFNPGGPADPCGLSSYEVARILYGLGSAGVDGFDYVEIYPPTDLNNVSSHTAVCMTLHLLAGLVKHRFNK